MSLSKSIKRIEVYECFILEDPGKLITDKKLCVDPINSFRKRYVRRALHISQVNIIGHAAAEDRFTDRFQIEPGKAVLGTRKTDLKLRKRPSLVIKC